MSHTSSGRRAIRCVGIGLGNHSHWPRTLARQGVSWAPKRLECGNGKGRSRRMSERSQSLCGSQRQHAHFGLHSKGLQLVSRRRYALFPTFLNPLSSAGPLKPETFENPSSRSQLQLPSCLQGERFGPRSEKLHLPLRGMLTQGSVEKGRRSSSQVLHPSSMVCTFSPNTYRSELTGAQTRVPLRTPATTTIRPLQTRMS